MLRVEQEPVKLVGVVVAVGSSMGLSDIWIPLLIPRLNRESEFPIIKSMKGNGQIP